MPAFMDGPMAGNLTFDPASDQGPPGGGPPQLGPPVGMGPPPGGDPEGAGEDPAAEEDEGAKFDEILKSIRLLLTGGKITQGDKLLLSKAESLLQQIKANEEKDVQSGNLTPRLAAKAYG